MKLIRVYILCMLLVPTMVHAQLFVANQATLHIDANTTFFIPQNIENEGIISNQGTIEIIGNWINPGTNTPTGTVIFEGTNQQIHQYGNTFYNVLITGGGNKQVPSSMYILNSIEFDNGYLLPIDTAKIILMPSAQTSIGSQQSYVKGTLYAKGTGNKYFAVGTDNLFLPAEFQNITTQNTVFGISVHNFNNTPIAGKGTRLVIDDVYWKMDVIEGAVPQSQVSLPIPPQYAANIDSIVVVESSSTTTPFESIGSDNNPTSNIPTDYVTSKDSAKSPIIARGILLDVNWDLLYIPNALSKNATNPNDRCIKVYGGIFKDEDFSFTITNQWGNKVFQTTSLQEMETTGWTGVNKRTNRRETTGQYFYYIRAIAKDNTPYTKAGSLWIID